MDASLWEKFVSGLAGISVLLAGLVWSDVRRRLGFMEVALETKATKSEIERINIRVEKIVDEQHLMALSVSRIEGQVGRIVSHLDSEQRTRLEANRQIMDELKEMRKSVTGMGRRVTKVE